VIPRGPGRPRSEKAEAAILDAALQMLADEGAARITMEALAARAGVGKATIYRRWKNKTDLLVDAVMRVSEPAQLVDTGDLRADLIAIMDNARRKMGSTVSGRIMPRLMSAAIDDPELMRTYWERAIQPRRALVVARLQRAVDAGELRSGLDLDSLCDSLFGPMVYRKLFAAARGLPTRESIAQGVDVVLIGALSR
jgi:AcrR family transcriptional regulator